MTSTDMVLEMLVYSPCNHPTPPLVREYFNGRRGADKSLARLTSRCRRTESILSLERGGLFMCRIASIFLLQRLKGSMSGDAGDFSNIETRAVIKFFLYIYRVSQEERTKLREGVPYVKLYRYNPKHLYPKLNGYGDNGKRSLKL